MTIDRRRLALCLSLVAIVLFFPGSEPAARTVCSVASAGRQFDTGVGGTGIDTGHGGTGIDTGQGGTGIDTGHGGTGLQADVGTGGTGIQHDTGTGGTGIIGVITGFGSICVNGTEVEYNAATAVDNNGTKGNANDLKVGQVVAVLANGRGERVFARHIAVNDALLGPVTRVDLANGRMEVMHQPVRVDAGTIMGTHLANVRPGEFVRISGFQTTTGVFASRIDSAPAGQVRMSGTVSAAGNSRVNVNGLNVDLGAGRAPAQKAEVTVVGQWQDNGIRSAKLELPPATPFDGKADYLSVQGRIGQRMADGSVQIGAMRVQLPANVRFEGGTPTSLRADGLVQIEGRIGADSQFHAEQVILGDRVARPDNARGDERARRGDGQSTQNNSSGSGKNEEESRLDSSSHGGSDSGADRGGNSESHSGSGHDSNRESKTEREQLDRIEKDARERAEKIERERLDQLEKLQREEAKQVERLQDDHSGKSE